MSESGAPSITPKVRDIIAVDRLHPLPVSTLTSAEIEELSAIATRRRTLDEPVRIDRALQALAAGTRPDIAAPVLTEVLGNREASVTDRVVAARQLGKLGTLEAEAALVRQIQDRDARIQQAIFDALGQFARPETLQELRSVPAPRDVAAHLQLMMAMGLVACRHGLDGPFLPRVEGVDRLAHELDDALSITIEAKSGQASASDWKRLAGPRYGIEPADQAYALSVGGTDSTVFINRDLNRSSTGLLELLQRPWIAAVIGRRSLEGSTVVSKFVVLTRPVGESARIDVVRRDGVITYTGTASWFGGQMAFMVSDVDRPGTVPTKVAGKLTAQGIKLDVGLLSSVRVGTRSAVPVVTAPEN